MNTLFSKTLSHLGLAMLLAVACAHGAVTYIGDDASSEQLISSGASGPDTANGGSITYGFTSGAYQNSTGGSVQIEIKEVNFWATDSGTLTPFVATYNGAGTGVGTNYTLVAVGDPIAGTAGRNNEDFEVGGAAPVVTVQDGESLVAGFHQSTGMVPWDAGTGDYLKEDNVIPAVGGTLPASATWSGLGRGYKFNIGFEVAQDPLPPTDIQLSNGEVLPASPTATVVGTLSTTDPNPSDNVFTYTLVAGAGDADNALFGIAGPRLETGAALGGVGSTYSIRVRSTDPGGLSVEKGFTITIIAGQAPTAITLSSTVVAADASPGTAVGALSTADQDPADVHSYTLVSGAGDTDNATFSTSGEQLRVVQALPPGGASLSIRVRATDLGNLSVEETFTILVIDPSVRISEFMASNGASLLDEDGDSSDWIEIFNERAEEVNLGGWFLTDDAGDLTKWQFPSRVVAGDSHLVVFASSKDRAGTNDPELHTSFKLTSTGEFLALVKPDGQTIASAFTPTFPPQTTDVSYGVSPDGSVSGFFSPPTPGAANDAPSPSGINTAEFTVGRGFYDAAFDVALTPTIPGSTIRYTTNGGKPSTTAGTVYSSPITISGTTTLRAIAYRAGGGGPASVISTHTYIFVDDVITQGVMSTSITNHPTWGPQMEDSLLEIPTVSLVKSGGVSQTESETSMELIFPDGTTGFQIDCGVEHFGGHSINSPKKNMRMSFKKAYGPSRLNYDIYGGEAAKEFDQIILRTGSHDTWFWTHPSGHGGIFVRGRWSFDRQLEAGNVAPRGRWVHAYINGIYHGIHHLMERPNAAFMASYLGGEKEEYEALNAGSPIDGDKSTWNAMKGVLGDYEQLKTYMDVKNYADYMLLQFYGGNDWDWNTSQNWSSASRKAPDAAYKFFAWDSDVILRTTLNANVVNRGGPENLWGSVKNHDEFKVLLADRAQKFFFNDGMLTRDRVLAQIDELTAVIEKPIIAETARWGNGSYTPSTWRNEINEVKNDLVDQRTGVVISQMRNAGVFPDFDAPVLNQFGGDVPADFQLALSLPGNAAGGQIYYTINGGDPIGDMLPPGSTETTLFDQGMAAKALIPSVANGGDSLGDSWKGGAEPFDDASWQSGTSGIGFDVGADYDSLIGLDLEAMQTVNASAFARIAFTLTQQQVDDLDQLRLDMKAEDGFVAYLNGVEIASLQKREPLEWNSTALGSTSDGTAQQFQPHDITPHIGELVVGINVLAFHLLNQGSGSSDLLCLPRLVGIMFPDGGGGDPTGQLYTGPVALTESGIVRARVQLGGQWSALEEVFFYVDAVAPALGEIVISEINYNPPAADDAEFIELQNISGKNLRLDGIQFVDGVEFTFPTNTVLEAGDYIVVAGDEGVFNDRYTDASSPWRNGPVNVSGIFTGSLDNGGEMIRLQDAAGADLLNVAYSDSGSWPGRADGSGSSAELADPGGVPTTQPELDAYLGSGRKWRPSSEYFGSPGRAGLGPDNRVVFNEILAHTDLPAVDQFELYNATAQTVDLSGWFISDDSAVYKKFQIPTVTTLDPGTFLTYDEGDFNAGESLIDFAINSARGDDLFLLEADGFGNLIRFVDRAEFGASANGVSFGRWPDGSGDFYPMQQQSSGQLNAAGGNTPRVGPLVVAEVHYNPDGADANREFVRVSNTGAVTEPLENWRLRGEVDFDFPAGAELAAGEALVLVSFDPADAGLTAGFRAEYGTALALFGPWSGGLDDGGGAIKLQRPDALEVPTDGSPSFYPMLVEDTVNYDDVAPWPAAPDGAGASLLRTNLAGIGDDPAHWAANADPLAARGENYEDWASMAFASGTPAADRVETADPDADGLDNFAEFAFALDPEVAEGVPPVTIVGAVDGSIEVTYRRRSGQPPLVYSIESSADLAIWISETDATLLSASAEEVTVSLPPGAVGRLFVRVVATSL